MKKIKNVFKKKRKLVLIIIVLLLGACLLVVNIYNRRNRHELPLDIHYSDSSLIKYYDFSKKFTDTRTITIENNTNKVKVYSLRWNNLLNTLKKQNLFLYEIKCEGYNCKSITPSQIPPSNANAIVFSDIYLEIDEKQEFTIKFIYKGSEKNAKFSGNLVIEEGVLDKQLYKTYMSNRDKTLEQHNKIVDKVINMK